MNNEKIILKDEFLEKLWKKTKVARIINERYPVTEEDIIYFGKAVRNHANNELYFRVKKARQEGIKLGFIEGYKESAFIKNELLKLEFENKPKILQKIQKIMNELKGIEYSTKLEEILLKVKQNDA